MIPTDRNQIHGSTFIDASGTKTPFSLTPLGLCFFLQYSMRVWRYSGSIQ